jgi:hypothetical protein
LVRDIALGKLGNKRRSALRRLTLALRRLTIASAMRRLTIASAIGAGAAASCVPAAAQFFGDRFPAPRYQQQPQQRDFFSFPFDNGGFIRPPPPVEATKPPPPRKLETPPANNVVVIGDSLADWLAYGLDETYADQPDMGVVRKIRPTSGLVRYDPKIDTLDWPQAVKDALAAEKPNAIVVMLGLNDRLPLRDGTPPHPGPQRNNDQPPAPPAAGQATQASPSPSPPAAAPAPSDAEAAPAKGADVAGDTAHVVPGGSYDFHTDQWAVLYGKRIDEMIAALKSKGVPVLWVGLPAIRGARSTTDMSYLDELYREHAEKAGIVYVDIWDGFVDEQGRFAQQGPDFEGQTRRLRTWDGVHFTKAGAVKLASYVDRELRRVMSNRVVPVALPAPDELPKPGAAGPRPAAGPVLPLTAGAGEVGDLLGGGGRTAPPPADPIASKVLSRGDPIAPPPGRADDFSWPRRGNDANAADVAPEPVALTPAAPATKAGSADAKKPADAKKAAQNKPAPPGLAGAH